MLALNALIRQCTGGASGPRMPEAGKGIASGSRLSREIPSLDRFEEHVEKLVCAPYVYGAVLLTILVR